MNRIQLIINGEARKVLFLNNEYFQPVDKSEDKYLKILHKNFPYTINDRYETFPYQYHLLPDLGYGRLDKELESEARRRATDQRRSVFGDRSVSEKDYYYQELTRLRYSHGLDRLYIPNLEHRYDMEVRPSETHMNLYSSRLVGGLFDILLESTNDDDFFYHWLFRGEMKNGELRVYRGDSDHTPVRIHFWDCYCVEIRGQMSALSPGPMYLYMRLSPAIVENRGVKLEKSWKKTELRSVPFKATPIAPPAKPRDLLITKVEGPREVLPKSKKEYFVAEYNQDEINTIDRARINWMVEADGKKHPQDQQGERLQLQIIDEWIGKEITITPYLDKPSPSANIKVKVIEFNKSVYFASSKRKPGKVLGRNETAEDMTYGDITPEELVKKDESFANFLKSDDRILFSNMYALARSGSLGGGKENALAIIKHFEENTGNMYSSNYMNERVKEQETFKKFVFNELGVLNVLCDNLHDVEGNINKLKLQEGVINSTSVKFNTYKDYFNGMTISVDGTMAYRVYVDNYELNSVDTFNCQLRIHIFDHYGLDWEDVQKFKNKHVGFNSWYILQHVRGYKPFLTRMEAVVPINNQKF